MKKEIKKLRELAKYATKGEWKFKNVGRFELIIGDEVQMCDEQYYPWCPYDEENWEWIAYANPDRISKLLDYLEELGKK